MKIFNPFIQILDLLSINYTLNYTFKYYETHPNKYNLLGISQMLDAYLVENVGVHVDSTSDNLKEFQCPFLACVNTHFVVVTCITSDTVTYIYENNNITIPIDNFIKMWSGNALLFAKTEESCEPDYKMHRKRDFIMKIQTLLFVIASMFMITWIYTYNNDSYSEGIGLQLLISGIGIAFCIPLMRMQIDRNDPFSLKVCSLLVSKSKCNEVTASAASKILGISLSSYGMSFFSINFIFLLCFPSLLSSFEFFNALILPFTVWSVWYQTNRLKEFCSLCIAILVCIWANFITAMIYHQFGEFNIVKMMFMGSGYLIGLIVIHSYSLYRVSYNNSTRSYYQLSSIKSSWSVFHALLQEQPNYEINPQLGLIIGNPNANNMITLISNPHCDPCSKLHPDVEDLLKYRKDDYCIQFILTSFSKELESSCYLWIAMNKELSLEQFVNFMKEWYMEGRYHTVEYYKKYSSMINDSQIHDEYKWQKEWLDNAQITNTPTVLFNGCILPEQYELKDIIKMDVF